MARRNGDHDHDKTVIGGVAASVVGTSQMANCAALCAPEFIVINFRGLAEVVPASSIYMQPFFCCFTNSHIQLHQMPMQIYDTVSDKLSNEGISRSPRARQRLTLRRSGLISAQPRTSTCTISFAATPQMLLPIAGHFV